MSKIELPPEPSAAAWRIDASYWTHHDSIPFALLPPVNEPEALFTADQLRAYGEQIVEVCAKVFEELHPSEWGFAAAAIRNLIEGANNG
jgi:hypothetical protein